MSPSPAPPAGPTAPAALPPRPAGLAPVRSSALGSPVAAELVSGVDPLVTGITHRTSDVRPGDLFVALPGAKVHGADFALTAIRAGAAAVLTDPAGLTRPELADAGVGLLVHPHPRTVLGALSARVYGDPTADLRVLGVTGTSGKTTVAHLLEAGLRAADRATGLLGTVQTRIGHDSLPSAFTTPEAPDLQALFGVMRERGVTDVAMEVSSHALALGRVAGTRFAVGAFTNLSQDHLDFHPTMEDYFQAKAKLFVDPELCAARGVVCTDDEWGARLAGMGDFTTVSTTGPADWTASGVRTEPDGSQRFTVRGLPVHLALPGAFNVANALLALAVLEAAGVDPAVAAPAFASIGVPGRMQRVDRGQDFLAVVDYAHKPAAVAALLAALRAQNPGGRLLTVLGCGGDRDTGKRPMMGAAAAARSDVLIVTDDNPRTEDPAEIRAAMLAGTTGHPAEVREIGDRRAAIVAAVALAKPGDVLVVAGKGHETGQEIHGVKHHFDDVEELTRAIASVDTERQDT